MCLTLETSLGNKLLISTEHCHQNQMLSHSFCKASIINMKCLYSPPPPAWGSSEGSGGPGGQAVAAVCQDLDQGCQPGDRTQGTETRLQERSVCCSCSWGREMSGGGGGGGGLSYVLLCVCVCELMFYLCLLTAR